jgi:hypothetical protein
VRATHGYLINVYIKLILWIFFFKVNDKAISKLQSNNTLDPSNTQPKVYRKTSIRVYNTIHKKNRNKNKEVRCTNFSTSTIHYKTEVGIVVHKKNDGKNLTANYIPWLITDQIIRGQFVLTKMYSSLSGNEKEFADKYLLPFLSKISSNTQLTPDFIYDNTSYNVTKGFFIDIAAFTGSALPIAQPIDTNHLLGSDRVAGQGGEKQPLGEQVNRMGANLYSISSLKIITALSLEFKDKACIYVFMNKENQIAFTYLGQTQNLFLRLRVRLKDHYLTSISEHRQKGRGLLYPYCIKLGGLQNLNFKIKLIFPTFSSLYKKEYNIPSSEFDYILKAFTEFKLGLYEQALISFYNPGLNTTKIISFSFLNWSYGTTKSSTFNFFLNSPLFKGHTPEKINLSTIDKSPFKADSSLASVGVQNYRIKGSIPNGELSVNNFDFLFILNYVRTEI